MITFPTLFIVGAGAHCSYGFPSGLKLKLDVANAARLSVEEEAGPQSIHELAKVEKSRCLEFSNALANSGQTSIDAFLKANSHKPGFDAIGKIAIARVLKPKEASPLTGGQDDWLSYLFKEMVEGINDPDDFVALNKISFVTFNYDRFLEQRLFNLLQSSFGLENDRSLALLQKIPIVHVYGMLGRFPIPSEPESLLEAANSISTIYDSPRSPQAIVAAKALMNDAKRLCILGFGFHRENIELLELPNFVSSRRTFASRFKISDAEWERVRQRLPTGEIHTGKREQKCLDVLRELPVF